MHRCCILAVKHWFCFSSSWLACTAAVRESEGVCVCERGKKGGGWVGGTEAACASTRDLPHSRLPPLCSSSLLFSSLSPCYFSFIFFFYFLSFFPFKLPPSSGFTSSSLTPHFDLLFLQFSRLSFLHCKLKMTPLILRSRSRLPPGQLLPTSKELCRRASTARICPF